MATTPPFEPAGDEGEQSAVLRVADIEAEARRRLLAAGDEAIAHARSTLAEVAALVDADADAAIDDDGEDAAPG